METTITIEKLKNYAGKLMFDLTEDEYLTLQKEFEVILKQMDLIGNIEGIKDVKPMTFPFDIKASFRKDEVKDTITTDEALSNAKDKINGEIKVPQVVE